LSKMGIDSMQVVEVRATVQRALGRPFPLEEVGTLRQPPAPPSHETLRCLVMPLPTLHMDTCMLAIPKTFKCPVTLD
jgi:hypothetical protein